jgi:hypothetical protein
MGRKDAEWAMDDIAARLDLAAARCQDEGLALALWIKLAP